MITYWDSKYALVWTINSLRILHLSESRITRISRIMFSVVQVVLTSVRTYSVKTNLIIKVLKSA